MTGLQNRENGSGGALAPPPYCGCPFQLLGDDARFRGRTDPELFIQSLHNIGPCRSGTSRSPFSRHSKWRAQKDIEKYSAAKAHRGLEHDKGFAARRQPRLHIQCRHQLVRPTDRLRTQKDATHSPVSSLGSFPAYATPSITILLT